MHYAEELRELETKYQAIFGSNERSYAELASLRADEVRGLEGELKEINRQRQGLACTMHEKLTIEKKVEKLELELKTMRQRAERARNLAAANEQAQREFNVDGSMARLCELRQLQQAREKVMRQIRNA